MPTGRAVTKERTRLHAMDIEWLAVAPFCVLATSDADGSRDASPKGDPAGHLVHVLGDTTVAIAERPGNRRADGYANVLAVQETPETLEELEDYYAPANYSRRLY